MSFLAAFERPTRSVSVAVLLLVALRPWVVANADVPARRRTPEARLSARIGWPFDPTLNPVTAIGATFRYDRGINGYQVPLRFELADVRAVGHAIRSAVLNLDVRLRVLPDQVQGTEGIWVDGILSGTTWPRFRVPTMILEDISQRNVTFLDAVNGCCIERRGRLRFSLDELLQGSSRTTESALADRRLDVVIADDVEVYDASLEVCRGGASANAPACVTIVARAVAPDEGVSW